MSHPQAVTEAVAPKTEVMVIADPGPEHDHLIPVEAPDWKPNPHTLIQAHRLVKDYPRPRGQPPRRVLKDVSLSVGQGRVHALMGLSGAGKSTVVAMLAGLLEPTSGEIYTHGRPVEATELRRLTSVAAGHDNGFYPRLPLIENLVFFAALLGLDRKRARHRSREVLDLVGLTAAAGRTPWAALSSGQKRQGHLARALLRHRPLLIADEPTRGLDPATEQRIVDLLTHIKASGQSMLLVTHDVHLASAMADWVSIMEAGQIIRSASPGDLLHLLTATRIYLRFGSDPGPCLERLEKLAHLKEIHSHDREVHVYSTDPETDINEVVKIIVEEGAVVSHIDLPEPGLEEVFLKVIAERKHHMQARLRKLRKEALRSQAGH
ncbi:MAG TPA: ABC transporter ATP-binding protein [Candidatus Dormibacteraeota bacterium]